MIGKGLEQGVLSDQEAIQIMAQTFDQLDLVGKKLLLIIPDTTRTAPMPMLYKAIYELVAPKVAAVDVLVALGTHPPMPEEKILEWVGITKSEHQQKYSKTRFFNHLWDDPKALTIAGYDSGSRDG